ncbi:MAG TPA: HAD-IA family hydrolase [Acidimicrobiales bacterium]|nr:HAD-IA family hydrolase [Acidimicrobiales bacterium]
MIKAVLWDFGGVILSSPFDAFARWEEETGLPTGFLRTVNAVDPHGNAWARLERNEVTVEEFCDLFELEAKEAGHPVDARQVLALLLGDLRPQMVEAVRRCKERLKIGMLTNNIAAPETRPELAEVMTLFDVVVESSKVGLRKPEPAFYELACRLLEIEPHEAVFLDDLGVNLKPARAMGMTTIKVVDPDAALRELEQVVGFPVR